MDTLIWNVSIHTHNTLNNLASKQLTSFNEVKSHLDPPCWSFTAAIPVNADILSDGYLLCTKLSFILRPLASSLSLSLYSLIGPTLCSWEGILEMLLFTPDIVSHLVPYYRFIHTAPISAAEVQPTISASFL